MDKQNWHFKENLWRPTVGENRLRIVPAVIGSGTTAWWMRVDIHNISLVFKSNKFVCNAQLFEKPCSLCEMRKKFEAEGEFEEAKRIGLRKYTFFNVIDRANEDEGVKVWMAPISAWWQIERAVFRGSGSSLIIDWPEKGTYGCDLLIYYDPNEQFKHRYKVSILSEEPRPLGTEEQIKRWIKEVLPLKPENFYNVVDELETQFVESSIRALVMKQREFKKREPLYEAIYERNAPFEQVKEANRILLALDGLSKKEIFEKEQEEFQSELLKLDGEISLYSRRPCLITRLTESDLEEIVEQLKKEKQELIKVYSEKNEPQMNVIFKDVESAYITWLENQEKGVGQRLLKLSIMKVIDQYTESLRII